MFVQKKNDELTCYEFNIEEYDNKESKIIQAIVLDVTENRDEYIFTESQPIEYVKLDVSKIEGVPLIT